MSLSTITKVCRTYFIASAAVAVASLPTWCPAPVQIGAGDLAFDQGDFPLSFPDTAVTGGPSRIYELEIFNQGEGPLTINSVALSGTNPEHFQLISDLPDAPLEPSAFWSVKVLFSPQNVGFYTAQLEIESDDPEEPLISLDLDGTSTNSQPFANIDAFATDEDVPLSEGYLAILLNDIDEDGGILGLIPKLEAKPLNGELALNRDGSFDYTPNTNFHGSDVFEYRVSDGFATSPPATVTVTVNSVIDSPRLSSVTSGIAGPTNSNTISFAVNPGDMPDPPETIEVSEDPAFTTFTSIVYTGQASAQVSLSGGDGQRMIYVRFRNEAGTSQVRQFSVDLDQTPPKVSPVQPLELVEARSTDIDNVDLQFNVALTESVNTRSTGRSVTGLDAQAVVLSGTASGLEGLTVTVAKDSSARSTDDVYTINVSGAVTSAGTVVVGFAPGMVIDDAGNELDVSGIVASASLSSTVGDWTTLE